MSLEFFKSHSLHDNYIHGFSYIDENYECDLTLDIDYIHEWHCEREPCEFVVSPAWLTFKNVSRLTISISKPEPTINSYLGIILDVKFHPVSEGRLWYELTLVGSNKLEFEASGLALEIWGVPTITKTQWLSTVQRYASN